MMHGLLLEDWRLVHPFATPRGAPEVADHVGEQPTRLYYTTTHIIASAPSTGNGVLVACVTALIVNAYNQATNSQAARARMKESKCFVCSINRLDLDKACPTGFQGHVDFEHPIWGFV